MQQFAGGALDANFRTFAVVAGCVLLAPGSARAWADAHIESASAEVRVDPDGSAAVSLTLSLRVRGGWVEGLEVAGLEGDAELEGEARMVRVVSTSEGDRSNPSTHSPRGEQLVQPRAQIRGPSRGDSDARLQLSFSRRSGPRRGRYRILVRYQTDIAPRLMPSESEGSDEGGRWWKGEWTLPAWQSGLDGPSVTLILPGAARFDPAEPTRVLEERARQQESGAVRLVWSRAHLPRTTPWTVHFEIAESSLAHELRQRLSSFTMTPAAGSAPNRVGLELSTSKDSEPAPVAPVAPVVERSAPAGGGSALASADAQEVLRSTHLAKSTEDMGAARGERSGHWHFAALLSLLALGMALTSAAFQHEARRRCARTHPLVPLALATRIAGLAGVASTALLGPQLEPTFAALGAAMAILLGWERSAEPAAPRPGRWTTLFGEPSLAVESRAPKFAAIAGWGVFAASWIIAGPNWALCALIAPLLHGGARRLPPAAADRRTQLRQLAAHLQVPLDRGVSCALVGHAPLTAPLDVGDIRLRLTLTRPRAGIVSVDLVLTDEPGPGGLLRKARVVLLSQGAVLESALAKAPAPESPPLELPGNRVLRLYRVAALEHLLQAVSHPSVIGVQEALAQAA